MATGVASYFPGALNIYRSHFFRTGATDAMTTYGIWMKHLTLARRHGMERVPRVVVELGPGPSVGVGLAALICGADRYIGLDAVDTLVRHDAVEIFDDLVRLFRTRTRPRNADGFPDYARPDFPVEALSASELDALLAPERIAALREEAVAFASASPDCQRLRHVAPWDESDVDCWGQADFVMSHAVLQHVSSPAEVFAEISRLLKPGGYTTHQVSFDSHEITPEWNGHWSCTPWLWKLALGRKAFLINRVPHSRMIAAAEQQGLEIRADLTGEDHGGITRKDLRPEWSWLEDRDLVTRCGFLVARKV